MHEEGAVHFGREFWLDVVMVEHLAATVRVLSFCTRLSLQQVFQQG